MTGQIFDMTNYEYLKELETTDKLKPLIKSGIIPPTIYNYYSVYNIYIYELRHAPTKMDAIEKVCDLMKTNQDLIYRAINIMKIELV